MRKPPDKKRNAVPVAQDGVDFRNSISSEGTAVLSYYMPMLPATEFASRLFSRRYRLAPHTARLVCHLAGIGGAA